MNLGRLYLFQERWPDSARHLNAAVSLYEEAGVRENFNLKDTYYLQGVLALEQGQVETAQHWAKRSLDLLREATHTEQGSSPEWGNYEVLMGRIDLAKRDLANAYRHLDRAVTILQEGGQAIETARALYWRARVSLKQDHLNEARQDFETSRTVLEQLGAVADLQRVDRQLAELKTTS
jgi:tetratricopeptide (TPR) repeat protein